MPFHQLSKPSSCTLLCSTSDLVEIKIAFMPKPNCKLSAQGPRVNHSLSMLLAFSRPVYCTTKLKMLSTQQTCGTYRGILWTSSQSCSAFCTEIAQAWNRWHLWLGGVYLGWRYNHGWHHWTQAPRRESISSSFTWLPRADNTLLVWEVQYIQKTLTPTKGGGMFWARTWGTR